MQPNRLLTVASLFTVLLFTFHWTDDIIRGMAPGGLSALYGVLILIVWLYGTLVLGERRSGHIIMLLGSLVAVVALVLHLRGAGLVGGRIANSGGKFSGSGRSSRSGRRGLSAPSFPCAASGASAPARVK